MRFVCNNGDLVFTKDQLEDKLCETFDIFSSKEIAQTILESELESENGVDLEKVDIDLIKDHLYCNVDQNETKQEVIDSLEEVLELLNKIKSKNPALSQAFSKVSDCIDKIQYDIFAI